MPRSLVWILYAALVLVWSSTWVVIAVGLEDVAPFFGAGIRFTLAGAGVLTAAVAVRRPLRTDAALAALIGLLPFATTYGLIYWAEQYVPSGLTAVLFGVLPLYVALLSVAFLPQERLSPRLLAGVAVALGGLVLAFGESLQLGSGTRTALAATAVVASPLASAIGNVAIKRRGAGADPLVLNGWAMLGGGLVLAAISALTEDWGATSWSAASVGSILYLAVFGTAFTFVTLTVLLHELPAMTTSFISLIIPFGALALGAVVRDEAITAAAVGGAALVAGGIAVAQVRPRPRVRA
ncbi:DMT family transporter [Candidatus Solirubrobacter pratensis]|uniref:DMT family transporter n=1 Tax=Candidatus Solirubrobacter pratensis TaxID=1298857 RepID=UPI000406B69A|nr:EamA family transporter [Candidatus Solirubrobacter pratensis]